MKLFMIKYKVELGQGADALVLEDQMAIPGKNEVAAKGMFLDIMSSVSSIVMSPGTTKFLVPMRALQGRLIVTRCKPVKTK